MDVFHAGRQGSRDAVIPLVGYAEPLAAVPVVLGIIKQPWELLCGGRARPFVLYSCST